jgi:hypothetical protein
VGRQAEADDTIIDHGLALFAPAYMLPRRVPYPFRALNWPV